MRVRNDKYLVQLGLKCDLSRIQFKLRSHRANRVRLSHTHKQRLRPVKQINLAYRLLQYRSVVLVCSEFR